MKLTDTAWAKRWVRVVQDCEHEGPHYGLRKNLRAAKRGTPLQLKTRLLFW